MNNNHSKKTKFLIKTIIVVLLVIIGTILNALMIQNGDLGDETSRIFLMVMIGITEYLIFAIGIYLGNRLWHAGIIHFSSENPVKANKKFLGFLLLPVGIICIGWYFLLSGSKPQNSADFLWQGSMCGMLASMGYMPSLNNYKKTKIIIKTILIVLSVIGTTISNSCLIQQCDPSVESSQMFLVFQINMTEYLIFAIGIYSGYILWYFNSFFAREPYKS